MRGGASVPAGADGPIIKGLLASPERDRMQTSEQDRSKRRVAERALGFVEHGMRLGLGSGSTAKIFVDLLAKRVAAGLKVRCVPTSETIRRQAEGLGFDVTTLDELPELDLTVDGADEFDPALDLIKGGGGALLREKIVAMASGRMIVIADASKGVDRLGAFPLPVEVNRFGLEATKRLVGRVFEQQGLATDFAVRGPATGEPFVTDGGHLILDCRVGGINDPGALGAALNAVPGVVEHGLFVGIATAVVTEHDGDVRVIDRPDRP